MSDEPEANYINIHCDEWQKLNFQWIDSLPHKNHESDELWDKIIAHQKVCESCKRVIKRDKENPL